MTLATKRFLFLGILLTLLGSFSATASAQTRVATFTLDNVWLNPDISHGGPPAPMSGTFEWTYTVGDFDNGSGEFLDIYVPWFGSDMSNLVFTIDLNSIEITMNGSYHGLGVDVNLKLTSDLSLDTPALTDTVNSSFHIEAGNYRGHMTAGSVHTVDALTLSVSGICPTMQFDIDGATSNGQVALLYARNQGSFVVPSGLPCAGLTLGLDSSIKLASMLTTDAAGHATLNANVPAGACGTIYLQALDLSACQVSDVVLLQ